MTSKFFNNPLTPQKKAIDIINYYFQKEREDDYQARNNAQKELLKFLIKTKDGSYTLKSNEFQGKSETMHTSKGAITESLEKFVKPSLLDNKNDIKVLDTCSGFGYNSAALIEYLNMEHNTNNKLSMDLIEISIETLAGGLLVPAPISSHKLVKKAIEDKLIEEKFASIHLEESKIPSHIKFRFFSDDARIILKNLKSNYYDAIFLDPFSPSKSPELYTIEFFKQLKRVIKDNGVLATYTSAAPVRYGLIESGFYIGEGPVFGRKSGGTIASLTSKNILNDISSNDERMIALSDSGIPFRDPTLNLSGEEILKNRIIERKNARGQYKFSSVVKAPIFLGEDLLMDKLGRRVLRNINKLNIEHSKSEKAFYLVCPQNDKCICGCNQPKATNSRDRINIMIKRLSKLLEHNIFL